MNQTLLNIVSNQSRSFNSQDFMRDLMAWCKTQQFNYTLGHVWLAGTALGLLIAYMFIPKNEITLFSIKNPFHKDKDYYYTTETLKDDLLGMARICLFVFMIVWYLKYYKGYTWLPSWI